MFLNKLNDNQKKTFLAIALKIVGADRRLDPRERQMIEGMRYEMGLGFLGGLLDKLLLRKFMLAQLEDVTLAQKLYYESGERVTPDMLKTAKQHLDR